MQQGSTILQKFSLRSRNSFHDPATPDGRVWSAALKNVTQSQGWDQLHWGIRLACDEVVDLLITWKSHADLQHFMTHDYRPFLTAIETLLSLHDSNLQSIPPPYILQLHPGMPSLELGAVSSLYELSFAPQLEEDLNTGLAIEIQLCRSLCFEIAQGVDDVDLFLGMDAMWAGQYKPSAPSSPSSMATEMTHNAPPQPETLIVMTEWTSQDAEKKVLDSGKIEGSRGDQFLTMGEYFTTNVLQKARAYTKHQAVFENVSASNVQWLNKEEKWSTYVARLLAEETQRKRTEAAE